MAKSDSTFNSSKVSPVHSEQGIVVAEQTLRSDGIDDHVPCRNGDGEV
jgi:hypothetical protein